MSIKQKLIKKEISCYEACTTFYNYLTKEDIDYIIKRRYNWIIEHLKEHPYLTKEHVDVIVKKWPFSAAQHLNQHRFFTQEHVDYIIKESVYWAVKFLSHKLSEENIAYIAHHFPTLLKDIFS